MDTTTFENSQCMVFHRDNAEPHIALVMYCTIHWMGLSLQTVTFSRFDSLVQLKILNRAWTTSSQKTLKTSWRVFNY